VGQPPRTQGDNEKAHLLPTDLSTSEPAKVARPAPQAQLEMGGLVRAPMAREWSAFEVAQDPEIIASREESCGAGFSPMPLSFQWATWHKESGLECVD
jgi:hypothetical protein